MMLQARFAAFTGTLVFSALLSACVGLPNFNSVGQISAHDLEEPAQGIVIFSVGAKEHCAGTANVGNIRHADGTEVIQTFSIDADSFRSDFADHKGVVDAFVLPEGHYVIRPSAPYADDTPVGVPSFGFDVVAGVTTYIGGLYMPEACTAPTRYEIRDRYERDMMAARVKNAVLIKHKVQRQLMKREPVSHAPT